jgi:hypothetical protein
MKSNTIIPQVQMADSGHPLSIVPAVLTGNNLEAGIVVRRLQEVSTPADICVCAAISRDSQ